MFQWFNYDRGATDGPIDFSDQMKQTYWNEEKFVLKMFNYIYAFKWELW